MRWAFEGSPWRDRRDRWFLSAPAEVNDAIEGAAGAPTGFGAVPVEVTIGSSRWRTSVFPSAQEQAYVLPVRRSVRDSESLTEGTPCRVDLRLLRS